MESIARISSLLENGMYSFFVEASKRFAVTNSVPPIARELTLDAASVARSVRSSSKPLDRTQVKKLLDSRNEREVLDGLRRVVSVGYTYEHHWRSRPLTAA
jgi:hypothetical protein